MSITIGEDFLLDGDLANSLYHDCSALPIIDYHSHLSPERLATDVPFSSLTDVWIRSDHYKWRAMRLNGVPERLCSGDADERETFDAWARTLPRTFRNPLYHWSALELLRYFGIARELTPETADRVWNEANELLRMPAFRPRAFVAARNVRILCTTDDPADDLRHHRALHEDPTMPFRVYPTYRPDAALGLAGHVAFPRWLERLRGSANMDVGDARSLLEALYRRHGAFHALGCRLSDHGLDHCYDETLDDAEASRVFDALRRGQQVPHPTMDQWRGYLMRHFAAWNRERNWVMMLHLGAMRNNNSALLRRLGLDTGCDSIGDFPQARRLNRFLDALNDADALPRTILFNSNPRDTHLFATIAGNFCEDGVVAKVQYGPAWWFLDTADGIAHQFDALSQVGLAWHFVGMVTDSRSFMSFPRHEYFRRVIATLVARDVEAGLLPRDARLTEFVRAVTYDNACRYFDWETSPC